MATSNFTPLSKQIKDITGHRFNRWTVLSYHSTKKHKSYWLCRCECKTERIICYSSLTTGHCKSCGCLQNHIMHGKSKTPEYRRWRNIMNRCYSTRNPDYKYYGSRGIYVENSWHKFSQFYKDTGNPPTPKHTLERLNNNGPYSKENCIWATRKEQSHNTRHNVNITINYTTKCLSEWCLCYNISIQTVKSRLRYGWPFEKAIITPVRSHKPYTRPSRSARVMSTSRISL